MECPSCGLVNPPAAERCDCGYSFTAGHAAKRATTTTGKTTACSACGGLVAKDAPSCPHCGLVRAAKKKTSPVAMGCLVTILGLVAFGFIAAIIGNSGKPPAAPVQPAKVAAAKPRLIVTVKNNELEHGYFKVSGTIENVGTVAVFSPSVTVEVYEGKTLVGKDTAYATGHMLKNMAPGASAAFESITRIAGKPERASIRWGLTIDKYDGEIRGIK